MDVRVFALFLWFLLTLGALLVLGTFTVHGLIWLLERCDPALPLRAKADARARAIEATLHAVREGLIKIPSVFRRTIE